VLLRSHTALAVYAVGLRQAALRQCILIATTAGKVFLQPSNPAPSLFCPSMFSVTSVFETN